MHRLHMRPCDHLVDPKAFATDAATWRPTPGASAEIVAGAWLQHEVARATLTALGKGADGVIAAATGEDRSTAHRKLHGRTTATFADIGAWAMLAGNSVLAAIPSEPRDTLPPAYRGRDAAWRPATGRLPLLAVSQLSWSNVVASVARSLADRGQWIHRLVDSAALRYLVSIGLIDSGLDPDSIYTHDEGLVGSTLLVGTAPVMVVETMVSRRSASAAEARATVSAFLASVHRLAAATSTARFVVVLGDPIADIDLTEGTGVGAPTAARSGADDPDTEYWEAELNPVDSLPVGEQHLWVVAVSKLDRA